jgi:hypothetical protein
MPELNFRQLISFGSFLGGGLYGGGRSLNGTFVLKSTGPEPPIFNIEFIRFFSSINFKFSSSSC